MIPLQASKVPRTRRYVSKKKGISRTVGDGFDRIEWLDAEQRKRSIRAYDPVAADAVVPGNRTRRPGKGVGQKTFQGHYWCAGSGKHVFHESMLEFTSMMLIDHLNDIVALFAQPMLLTFADGTFHYPDFFAILVGGERLLMDAHSESLTTDEDRHRFELTRSMCERLGWRYVLLNDLTTIVSWNLEFLARYHHPRFAPSEKLRTTVLGFAASHATLGRLMGALRTTKPGENIPALIHMFWKRELSFDLTLPLTPETPIWVA